VLLAMSGVRGYLHRYWFRFADLRAASAVGAALGCGVTAVDQADAERLLVSGVFSGRPLPAVEAVVEDVDVNDVDAGPVLPNMGDPSVRGVWFPRV
jgi:hypothetical protein